MDGRGGDGALPHTVSLKLLLAHCLWLLQQVFHFDCAPTAFRGALERFASQFEAPLCAESATAREVRAVDSEFTQAQQSDSARLLQVQCACAPAGHPAALFSWVRASFYRLLERCEPRLTLPPATHAQGNAKSLVTDVEAANLSLRKLLLVHHSEHYRAGRMTLALVAAEPLDTLEAWVRELFGRVPSGGVARPEFAPHGSMISGSTGVLFRVPAVKEAHDLVFTFALPPLYHAYTAKPEEYASHLLGHEGAGSLLSALKARGWASALCAGVSEGGHERSTAAWLFAVGVTLTEAGLAAWRDVAAVVFQYIRLLRDAGPQRFVFDELRAVKETEFRFAEEEDGAEYVSRLAASAERYAPEHAVAGEYLLTRFDPEAVMSVLAALTPHNCRLDLQSSSFSTAAPEALAEPVDGEPGAAAFREQWMDVPFGRVPLPRALLDAWATACPSKDLALPPRNAFLATDFVLRGSGLSGPPAEDDDTAFPLIDGTNLRAPAPPLRLPLRDARFRAWHKLDGLGGRFGAPRAASFWAVTPSSLAAGGPLGEPLTHLVLKVAEDALAEVSYLADVAGLRCHTTPEGARFELKIDGFSHKLPVLSAELFAALAALPSLMTDEARLARVREALLRRLRNALVKPAKHAGYLRLLALRQRATPVEAQLAALQAADSAKLAAHAASMFACCSVDALVMGNLTSDEASALVHAAAAALPAGHPVAAEVWPHEAVLQVPPGGAVLFAVGRNAADDNSVTELYFQIGTFAESVPDVHARAMADLLAQCIGEPCFDTLRTKEQLGYTVSSGVRLTHGVLGFAISVQSAKHGPSYLDTRIDAFLAAFANTLRDMPADEFERNRAAVISVKLQKERALIEEADRHWDAIWHLHYNFALREHESAALAAIQRDELCTWFAAHLAPGAPRRKLCVRVSAVSRAAEERAAAMADARTSAALFVEDEAGVEVLRSAWAYFPVAPQVEPAC